jgi:anti-sigma-K factor RskA
MSEEADIPRQDDGGAIAAEYVLGVLAPEEHAAVGERLGSDPVLRADVRFWRARLARNRASRSMTGSPGTRPENRRLTP